MSIASRRSIIVFVKQSKTLIVMIGALLALLATLGAVQYVWLGQISEAERERLHQHLQTDMQNFARDFNKEIRAAYYTFQVEAGDWQKKDYANFNIRRQLWQRQTAYPQLVRDFYFVEGNAPPLRYDAAAQSFQTAEWTAELRDIQSKIRNRTEKQFFDAVVVNTFTLLMPDLATNIKAAEAQNGITVIEANLNGYLIIELDENSIHQLLSDLRQRYFSDESTGYDLSVTSKTDAKNIYSTDQNNSAADEPNDGSVALFDLSSNNFEVSVNGSVISTDRNATRGSIVSNVNKSNDNNPPLPTLGANGAIKLQVADNRHADAKLPETNGLWTLNARHSDGSLDAHVANTRRRNAAFSFGVLGLLAFSVVSIYTALHRAQILAQRQVDFVSAVSHEFRTPLAVIRSAGENLADGITKEPAQIARYGELIKGEGVKLSKMVEQILAFAGANSGKMKYDFRQTNAREIVEHAIAECEALLIEKGLTIEKNIGENLPVISADKIALSQAIQNLIVNAVKYSDGDRRLRISAQRVGERIKIIVEDHGIGIAPKDLKLIFEPFYRAESVVEQQIHGSGLGLSLVKQTVEKHGGKVTVESEIGAGSRFTIILFGKKENYNHIET